MSTQTLLHLGQHQARTRWGTHESGAAFDRKKTPYLTERAQEFIAQQAMCVIAGLTPHNELDGVLVLGEPGFVQVLDESSCLLQLESRGRAAHILRRLHEALSTGQVAWLGLFFICHPTRERLCVQGTVEMLSSGSSTNVQSKLQHVPARGDASLPTPLHTAPAPTRPIERFANPYSAPPCSPTSAPPVTVRLHVREAFFHCSKYIRTRIAGLTVPGSPSSRRRGPLKGDQRALSEEHCRFLSRQVLGFLCTVNRQGQCAVNHRGGAPGFLVSLPPSAALPGGIVLLPDFAGNGAFEAVGNILETEQAALVVPNYDAQVALCVSGTACVVEPGDLHVEVARSCVGAERIIALAVQRVEVQGGDWSATLAYERARAASIWTNTHAASACTLE